MPDHCWLSEAQFERIKHYFPRSHGVPRVEDRRDVRAESFAAPRTSMQRACSVEARALLAGGIA